MRGAKKAGMKAIIKFALTASILLATSACASSSSLGFIPCSMAPKIQAERSEELQKIYDEDQSDYRAEIAANPEAPLDQKKIEQMGRNDLKRRKRVGEILGEGCFTKSADYVAAAMIYQHGNAPDHYFQAFLWSKQAVLLGDVHEKDAVAKAVDRYLVSVGHKQLFGTQLFKALSSSCFCLQPTEESFPDSTREEYLPNEASYGMTFLNDYNGTNNCPEPYCSTHLAPSPRGTVVGFW
jgi:hypothetical protein